MTAPLRLETCRGAALTQYLPALASLRIRVFREWPYLYDGSEAYERAYLETYQRAPGAAVVVAFDDAAVVGAATCLPMAHAAPEVQAPFTAAGWDIATLFYFGESVLLRPYRGRGAGVAFFAAREAQARAQGAAMAVFCAVERPASHPARPADATPLDGFWQKRGYAKLPGLVCQMRWRDTDEAAETAKTMQFWARTL